jgi:hypothetical protein
VQSQAVTDSVVVATRRTDLKKARRRFPHPDVECCLVSRFGRGKEWASSWLVGAQAGSIEVPLRAAEIPS